MNPSSQLTLVPAPAKFRAKFGAIPNARRMTFAFNAIPSYGTPYAQGNGSAVAGVIRQRLTAAGWNIINVYASPQVAFYRVEVNAYVYNTYDLETAGRALTDTLGNDYTINNFIVTDSAPPSSVSAPPISGGGSGSYTVVSGDTLSRIAARYGTTWQALAALNNLTNPNLLEIGQVLRIAGNTTPNAPQPLPPVGSTAPPAPLPSGNVKSGIEGWASKLGLSVSALALLAVVGGMVVISSRQK